MLKWDASVSASEAPPCLRRWTIARRVRTLVDSADLLVVILNKLKKRLYKVKVAAYDYPKGFSLESSNGSSRLLDS